PASLAATPLGGVLPAHPSSLDPVIEGAFRPRVTPLGSRHPVTEGLTGANVPADPASNPVWGPWYRRIDAADIRGETLMSGPNGEPLLVVDRVGEGRAAL